MRRFPGRFRHSPTEIVITMPAGTSPGTYLLKVWQTGVHTQRNQDYFDVTGRTALRSTGPTSGWRTSSVNMQFSQDDRMSWAHIETLSDDTCSLNIPLGFTFNGFGATTNIVSVSSNGILFFGSACSTEWNNSALPAGISTNAMLFFFWEDLQDFGTGEFMEYATLGSAPGRVFNLYFRLRLHDTALCGSDAVNVMVSVHERSNLVKASYSGFSGCASMRGSGATFGLQTAAGAAGADAFLVGFNSPVLDENGSVTGRQTMSFHPPVQ